MVANIARASSRAGDAFWKKSFQTSTGYILWLSSEQFSSVTKLLGLRRVALDKIRHVIKQRLGWLMDICLGMVM